MTSQLSKSSILEMKIRPFLPIVFITILAALLRFWKLADMPPSLNWDEVSHGYNAYSILKTGRDEWGVFMPHIFRAFGDYKLPVYIYSTVIPVFLFGLNAFAVRFVSALAGTLAIPGIYLLTKQLFPHKSPNTTHLALIASLLLAISPWHFFISRPALEANLALTFIVFGGYFLLRYFEKTSSLLPSAILFSLSLHTYNTARIFVPLLLIASLFVYYRHRESRPARRGGSAEVIPASGIAASPSTPLNDILGATILLLSASLVLFQVYLGVGTARYDKLKILSDAAVFQIGEKRQLSNLSPIVARLVYNRPLYFAETFTKNYFNYFSPQFFFQSKGAQSQFAIPSQNMLTLPIFLFAIIGLFLSLREFKSANYQFLVLWLLLSPVAAALTLDPPQALRPNPMIPALIILASIAISRLSKKISWLALLLALISSSFYLINYWTTYRVRYSSSWQYGYSLPMDFIRFYKGDYSKFFVTKRLGEPHIFYSFYNKLDPRLVQPGSGSIRFEKSDWFWTDKIDNVYFVNDWDIPSTIVDSLELESGTVIPTKNSILITSSDHVPVNASVIETIYFLDETPAFIITYIP